MNDDFESIIGQMPEFDGLAEQADIAEAVHTMGGVISFADGIRRELSSIGWSRGGAERLATHIALSFLGPLLDVAEDDE
ncbi:hypothetical protein [Streptomyces sp. NPDC007063]|uniref:hypothetical protein n=1 Tax=Streptomyces sp. NPDC007063 TaxID=3364772 RepID=UPI0036B6961D